MDKIVVATWGSGVSGKTVVLVSVASCGADYENNSCVIGYRLHNRCDRLAIVK